MCYFARLYETIWKVTSIPSFMTFHVVSCVKYLLRCNLLFLDRCVFHVLLDCHWVKNFQCKYTRGLAYKFDFYCNSCFFIIIFYIFFPQHENNTTNNKKWLVTIGVYHLTAQLILYKFSETDNDNHLRGDNNYHHHLSHRFIIDGLVWFFHFYFEFTSPWKHKTAEVEVARGFLFLGKEKCDCLLNNWIQRRSLKLEPLCGSTLSVFVSFVFVNFYVLLTYESTVVILMNTSTLLHLSPTYFSVHNMVIHLQFIRCL